MPSINHSSIMQDYEDETNHTHHEHQLPPKERDQASSSISILQGLNTVIQLHFEKTLEKKRSVDAQKKYLWKLFHLFFILLSLILFTLSQSHSHQAKLQCRHCWIPITFLTLSHLIFYIAVAHTLRCINGFKYQRRCHKLTLCLATEKLRQLKARMMMKQTQGLEIDEENVMGEGEFEIPYQEPDETYFAKFKRNWAKHFAFILLIYAFMVSSSVVLLCSY